MALSGPGVINEQGIYWEVLGKPYSNRTAIRVLRRGPYAEYLDRPMRTRLARMLVLELRARVPVDTGMLRESIYNNGEWVFLGPRPYNRNRLKAIRAGRVYKPRKRNPKLAKYYALPANERSRNPEYVEESISAVTGTALDSIQQQQRVERELYDLVAVIDRTQPIRGVQPLRPNQAARRAAIRGSPRGNFRRR